MGNAANNKNEPLLSEREGISPWEEKVREYVNRIASGEDSEKVLSGLGPFFRASVERVFSEAGMLLPSSAVSNGVGSIDSVDVPADAGEFVRFLRSKLARIGQGGRDAGDELLAYGAWAHEGWLYDAHGIAKGSLTEQIERLVAFLETGINPEKPFHTIPFCGKPGIGTAYMGAAGGAYKDGLFVLLSEKGKPLVSEGGLHIAAVAVNEAAYPIVSFLESRYPEIRFVRADGLGEFFESTG